VSFLKMLLGLAFLVAVLFFAVLNLEETIDLRLWADAAHTYRDVPLVLAVFFAYLFGIVTHFIVSLARDIRLRTEIGKLRGENRSLQDEILKLRGSALDDLPMTEAGDGAAPGGRGA